MFMLFHAPGIEDAVSICHSALALSVAIWVYSFTNARQKATVEICG